MYGHGKNLLCFKFGLVSFVAIINQSINQLINLYLYQGTIEPIVARSIHIKRKKSTHTLYKITTQTNEKREKLSRYQSLGRLYYTVF